MLTNKWLRRILIVLSSVVFVVCLVRLAMYAADALTAAQTNHDLAALYHMAEGEPTEEPLAFQLARPMPSADAQTAQQTQPVTAPPATAAPQATYDPFGGYPDNPKRLVAERFRTLRSKYPDVCGWLTIGDTLDLAVVQRDNSFFLTRDYTGRRNANGAIFLDEQIRLTTRPSTYILYGHNMKTGAMFGSLHKYTRAAYLRDNCFLTFDTMYEPGRFAIFASGTVSLDPVSLHFVRFYNLPDASGDQRMAIIDGLRRVSEFRMDVDVTADDQVLMLVTCTGDDNERRFVAARRIRSGETESMLRMAYLTMVEN